MLDVWNLTLKRRVYITVFVTLLGSFPAGAVDFEQSPLFRQLRFNFGNPGARALAMGGAFIGRADDASAAEANPSGLISIADTPQITVELRSFSLTQHLAAGGNAPDIETLTVSSPDSPRLTFASAVFPQRRSTLAVYFHTPFDYRQTASLPRAIAVRDGASAIFRSPTDTSIDYRAETYAAAGAWCLTGCEGQTGPSVEQNRLSIGGALKVQRLSARLTSRYFTPDKVTLNRAVPERLEATIGAESNDIRVSYTLGARWLSRNDRWGIGAVYKSGATFNILEFCTNPPQGGVCVPESTIRQSTFSTPDVFGIGASFHPNDTLTVSADVTRVNYSVLARDFIPAFPGTGTVSAREAGYRLTDVSEIHTGAEWEARPKFTVRMGYWYEPRHSLEYVGRVVSFDERLAALLYPGGKDLHHVTAGIGYGRDPYLVHVAFDHAPDQRSLAISLQLQL